MQVRTWAVQADIPAPASAVWSVLTDFDGYGRWNPFTPEVRCSMVTGTPVDMRVDLGWAGVRWQREHLRIVEPGVRLVWALDIGADWLIAAEREQRLVATSPQQTRYTSRDTIRGLLLPVVGGLFGGVLQRGFDEMALALKEEVLRRG